MANQTGSEKNLHLSPPLKNDTVTTMAITLRRAISSLKPLSSSSTPSTFLSYFSSSASSSSKSTTTRVSAATAAADVIPVEELILTDDERDAVPTTSVLPSLLQPRVVVYDGVCHLCHAGVKWVIKADKYEKIKFCCLQSRAAEPYLRVCGVEREDVLRRFIFIEGHGLYHEASTAALKVASYLPLPYSALSSLLILPTPLRDAIYDYVAKNRYKWFGKEDDCLVLKEKELLGRFIDREELVEKDRWKF